MARRFEGDELYSKFVGFHVTETQYENLRREARLIGLGMSEYLRGIVAGRRATVVQEVKVKGPDVRAELEALARIGNNLNQIAHALNAGKEPDAAMAKVAEHAIGEFEETARKMREIAGRWTGDGCPQAPLE